MPYDGGDLYVKVELYINGAFIEVTTRARGGRAASGVEIDRGRGTGSLQAESANCSLTLGNADAFVTEGNPESPWHPYVGRGCRIRVSVSDVAVSDVVRFDGEIDTMVAVYPGGSDSSVRITATGVLGGTLGLGADPLHSPLHRSMSGVSDGDFVPVAYWSLEDDSGSTQFASAIAGHPAAAFSGAVSVAADASVVGSGSLPTLGDGARVTATVPSYTGTGTWQQQFFTIIPSVPSADADFMNIYTTPGSGSTIARIRVYYDNGAGLMTIAAYDGSGTLLSLSGTAATYDTPLIWAVTQLVDTGNLLTVLGKYDVNGFLSQTNILTAGNTGAVTRLVGSASSANAGWTPGHWALYTDPAVVTVPNIGPNAAALGGHAGETVDERLDRLCREEGIAITITGTSTQTMGPQRVDTLANLLIDAESVDGGLLSDGGDGGGLAFRCLSTIVNQTASLAVTQGSLDVDVAPIWDNRNIRNDVTISRPGGSSARVTDEAHIARTRKRIKDSDSANVETDEQLPDQAGWRVNVGTADGPRYNGVGINLRNSDGRLLADAVLALEAGDRFTAAEAALPSQHPPGGIDGLVIGWREELDKDKWLFAPNVVPYAPNVVAELDSDDLGKLDTAGCVMQAAATDVATSFTVATTVLPRWTTDAGEMPIPILVSGQVNSVTAVSNVSPSFVAAGTVAHANNASVTPTMPAGVQAGDLLLVLAAIRNSGTGTVNTPSGYTVLLTSGNLTLLGKVHTGTESAPLVTFTGGVANADTSAQMCAFRGTGITVHASTAQLNGSAQDIAYPALDISRANCAVLYVGWKQDDWTSVASPGTEIGEPDTTTGDDQGIVWAYVLQTTAAAVASGSFTVTGGASAISRGAVVALATDVQTMTVTRGTNGVTKAIPIGSQVNVYRPFRLAL